MDDVETRTDVEVPTPTEVVEASQTEAMPEQVTTPAEKPTPAAVATETQPEIPWADKPDFRDVLDMDEVQPALQRRDQRREGEIRQTLQAQYDQETQNWRSSEAHQQLAAIYGNVLKRLQDSDLDGTEKLIDRLDAAIEPYKETYIEAKKGEGAQGAARELFQAVMRSLDRRGQEDFQDYLLANRSANWDDVLTKRDEIREGKTKESWKTEKQSFEARIEDLKVKARPEGPDTTPKGGGGTKKYSEMTPEERKGMSSEEVDAQLARERGER